MPNGLQPWMDLKAQPVESGPSPAQSLIRGAGAIGAALLARRQQPQDGMIKDVIDAPVNGEFERRRRTLGGVTLNGGNA